MKKKLVSMLLVAAMSASFMACGTSGKDSEGSVAEKSGTSYKIGICNYVDDASLNQIVDNIEAQLKELGNEKDVTFDVQYDNCNADSTVMEQIIADFTAEDVDLMVGVATPVAMKMQAVTEDTKTPVVFAAVSDPVTTGMVESLEKPGANVTGTSDYLNTAAVLDLIFAQNPEAKKIGLLYDVGQDSSTTPIKEAKAYLKKKGVECVEATGTTNDEVAQAAKELVTKGVDAVFTPTDNTIMTAELSIYDIFTEAKIPHYCGADSFALNGSFVGYGVDYASLGVETANMISEILVDGKDPAELPVKTFDNGICTVNTEVCDALGYKYEDVEKTFSPLCTKVNPIKTAEDFGEEEK